MENKNNKTIATIYDVAKEADVSLATVSRVLNNSAVVRKERRDRVEAAIKKLNFKPNEIARGLARKSTTTIGVIVPDINRSSVAELLSGIIDTANLKQYGYSVLINSYMGEESEFCRQMEHLSSSQVDGILVMCDVISEKMRTLLENTKVPIILFSTPTTIPNLQSITIDYQAATKEVIEYFINKKYSDILFLSRVSEEKGNEMLSGYQLVCEQNGVTPHVVSVQQTYEKNYEYFMKYLKEKPLPQGVFATSDSAAIAFLNAAIDLGHSVPGDVELISFSNTKSSVMSRPQLTSIMYPVYKIGAYAMSAIKKSIKGEPLDNIDLGAEYQIIWRDSTK